MEFPRTFTLFRLPELHSDKPIFLS